jgi:mono/diheme cytochrome c family protein
MRTKILLPWLCLAACAAFASTPPDDLPVRVQVLSDPDAAARGEKIFNGTCTFCHGHEGTGGQGRPLKGQSFDPDRVFKIITKGRTRGGKRMPPYQSTFSERQRWELVSYLLSLE